VKTEAAPPSKSDLTLSAEERELGVDCDITRRDFLNAAALGGMPMPARAALSIIAAGPVSRRRVKCCAIRHPLDDLTFAHGKRAGIAAWWHAGAEGVRVAALMLTLLS
jgi:hypothetical protein